jgi:hypothetical protein
VPERGSLPALVVITIYDLHARVPETLLAAAREAPEVPAGLGVAALVRLALARLAGWPDSAALAVTVRRAAPRRSPGGGQ